MYWRIEVERPAKGSVKAARNVARYDAATRRGEWQWQTGKPIGRIRGSVFGLLSFGAIARAVADRARPFGVEVWAHDPFVDDEVIRANGAKPVSFAELVRGSDYLVIQSPLTAETRGMFDEDAGYRQQTIIEIPVIRHPGEPLQLQLQHFLGLIDGTEDAAAELDSLLPAHDVIDRIERVAREARASS